jgi:acetyl esterase/lipase
MECPCPAAAVQQIFAMLPVVENTDVAKQDRTVPGPDGDPDITVRIYRPVSASDALPGIYFIHGGGMVLGDIAGEDATAAMLCAEIGAVVVSVEYRLAPSRYLGGKPADQYAAPTRAADVSGLPSTYIDVGTVDLFRDEDVAFAQRLMQAGVACELHVNPGSYHGSETFAPDAALSQRIWATRIAALRRALT